METFYAAPNATGDGLTVNTPGSLAMAKILMQASLSTTNCTVFLRGGIYAGAAIDTLTWGTRDSGHNGFKGRWRGYPPDLAVGNPPIFSGGVNLTDWSLHDAGLNIWSATVPTGLLTRQFYVNDLRAPRARWAGNMGLWARTGPVDGSDLHTTDTSFPTISIPTDLECVYTSFRGPWAQWRLKVATVTREVDNHTSLTMDINGASTPAIRFDITSNWGVPLIIENAYEFLNSPGEWYLNTATSTMYYIPRAGEDMATATAMVPSLETIFNGTGYLANVSFEDIIIEGSTWLAPSIQGHFITTQQNICLIDGVTSYDGDGWFDPRYTSLDYPPSAVVIGHHANSVNFERVTIKKAGGGGFHFSAGSKTCKFTGIITDVSSNGIRVGDGGGGYYETSTLTADKTSGNQVYSSKIHDFGVEYKGAVGICYGAHEETKTLYNEIYNGFYSGIADGSSGSSEFENYCLNGEIAYNRIYNVMTELNDGAAIYSRDWHTGQTIHGNYMYNVGKTTGLANARYLYSDDLTNDTLYYNNVCERGDVLTVTESWLLIHNPWYLTPSTEVSITAYDTYADTGLSIAYNDVAGRTTAADAALTIGVISDVIKANSGVKNLLFGVLLEGAVTAYGWRSEGEEVVLTLPEGVAQDYAIIYPDTDTWMVDLSGVTIENISGISALVVGPTTTPLYTVGGLAVTLKTLSGLAITPRYRVGGAWQ